MYLDSRLRRSLRAIGLVLMPPAVAVVVGPLIPGSSANVWVVVSRFLTLGIGVVILSRLGTSRRDGGPPVLRYGLAITGVGLIAAALEALFPTPYTAPLRVAVMAGAAATEEVMFRAELPGAIAAALGRVSSGARELAGIMAAQLSFAFTHLAVHDGITTGQDVLEVVRLFGCGVCSAIVYRAGGLVPAALVHAFVNYATYTSRFGMPNYPPIVIIVLWTTAVSIVLVACLRLRDASVVRYGAHPSPSLRPAI